MNGQSRPERPSKIPGTRHCRIRSNSKIECGDMSEAETTTDHETIKSWAEERGGHPATVRGTARAGEAGLLRLDFEPADENLEPIS
jgi:hypothetical protein